MTIPRKNAKSRDIPKTKKEKEKRNMLGSPDPGP